MLDLPVKKVLPDVASALAGNHPVILQAPPGTGKTLLTAPYLCNAEWLEGRKIILLEPRRLAARAAASRMASLFGERTGETVGYQIRLDRCIGPRTRIEVVTEGLLVQRLLHDPSLEDIGLVIFDEFHERSLSADTALALAMDSRAALRPDLRLLVMSATIDAGSLSAHIADDTRIVTAEARVWPVETRYLSRSPSPFTPVHETAAGFIRQVLEREEGGILVFLPGEGEIRRTEEALLSGHLPPDVDIYPLYGSLPRQRQDSAVDPAPPGRRKVVLSTSIAESSLTIQDIRIVIDAGLMRVQRFSPRNGMSRLETVRVTRDRADQRRGRAGRLGPGLCLRLWDQTADAALLPESMPEILDADLAPLRLQVADWGARGRLDLPWVTPPPESSWRIAGDLLVSLEALDQTGAITQRGRRLAGLPVHPRLAHAVEKAGAFGAAPYAALVAAVVEEAASEPTLRSETDAARLVRRVCGDSAFAGERRLSRDWIERVHALASQWSRGYKGEKEPKLGVGRILSWAFPDRIARRRGPSGQFRLTSGKSAVASPETGFSESEWIVVADLQDTGLDLKVRLAADVDFADIVEDFSEQMQTSFLVRWDRRTDRVAAVRQLKLGSLTVEEAPVSDPPAEEVLSALYDGIRLKGVENLGWDPASRNLQARILYLRRMRPADNWPDVSDVALAENLEEFLGGWLDGVTRWDQIKKISLTAPLEAMTKGRMRLVDSMAPHFWLLPCGHRARIYYDQGEVPVMSAKLQDFFGMRETPLLAGGIGKVKITLLSPAQRPVAVTDDLAGFWKTGYPLVRKDMRGRYPKHSWPENP